MSRMKDMKGFSESQEEFEKPKHKETGQYYKKIKPFFDFVFTIIASPVLLLIIFLTGILIKIDSEGPIFYTQERVGLNGNIFTIYKLRSMKVNAEEGTGAIWAGKNDPRITRVGKFIRKVRIDELPQFANVLLGDMSIIGPRPERPDLTEQFALEIPGFKDRLLAKPGITGFAQVNGGYDISPEEKVKFDKYYIKNQSLILDAKIVMKTIKVIFTGHGAR